MQTDSVASNNSQGDLTGDKTAKKEHLNSYTRSGTIARLFLEAKIKNLSKKKSITTADGLE